MKQSWLVQDTVAQVKLSAKDQARGVTQNKPTSTSSSVVKSKSPKLQISNSQHPTAALNFIRISFNLNGNLFVKATAIVKTQRCVLSFRLTWMIRKISGLGQIVVLKSLQSSNLRSSVTSTATLVSSMKIMMEQRLATKFPTAAIATVRTSENQAPRLLQQPWLLPLQLSCSSTER